MLQWLAHVSGDVERGGEQWEFFVSHSPRPPPFQLVVEQGFQGGREINAWGKATKAIKLKLQQHHQCTLWDAMEVSPWTAAGNG